MKSYSLLSGKVITDLFINDKKTILVFITNDGAQFELITENTIKFSRILRLRNLTNGKAVSNITPKSGFLEFSFKDEPDSNTFIIGIEPTQIARAHYPELNLVNGDYALSDESFEVKKIMQMKTKEKVFQLTDDFDIYPLR